MKPADVVRDGWVIAVDPGVHGIGWARLCGGRLDGCGYSPFEPTVRVGFSRAVNFSAPEIHVVIEVPKAVNGRSFRGDTNDSIRVAIVAGRIAELAREVAHREAELVTVNDWKGTRSKKVDHPLTLSRLSETERLYLSECGAPGALLHNVIDAIGIGLWKVGRR